MATATSTAASASPLTSLAVPIQALATSSWTASVSKESTLGQEKNSIDEFLGYCLATSATMESRHDRAHSVAADVEAPPPYMEEDADLPKYSQVDEPVTLAMYLFHFGFCEWRPLFTVPPTTRTDRAAPNYQSSHPSGS